MPLWSSMTSYILGNSTSISTSRTTKMNTQQPPSPINVRVERQQSIPISPSYKEAQTSLPFRPIDPAQTLQLPFHESQKAETPFATPLGESMIIVSSSRSSSPTQIGGRTRGDGEEKLGGPWTDGWVKIVDLTKEEEMENQNERDGKAKKRCKKECRSDDVGLEPVRKKSRDYGRSPLAKKSREDKARSNFEAGG